MNEISYDNVAFTCARGVGEDGFIFRDYIITESEVTHARFSRQ